VVAAAPAKRSDSKTAVVKSPRSSPGTAASKHDDMVFIRGGQFRRDPLKENPSTLISILVERTMAGGRWTFER
jgi:hypothetical protein